MERAIENYIEELKSDLASRVYSYPSPNFIYLASVYLCQSNYIYGLFHTYD